MKLARTTEFHIAKNTIQSQNFHIQLLDIFFSAKSKDPAVAQEKMKLIVILAPRRLVVFLFLMERNNPMQQASKQYLHIFHIVKQVMVDSTN